MWKYVGAVVAALLGLMWVAYQYGGLCHAHAVLWAMIGFVAVVAVCIYQIRVNYDNVPFWVVGVACFVMLNAAIFLPPIIRAKRKTASIQQTFMGL